MFWATVTGEKRFFVEGALSKEGINELDFVVFTLCERAMDDLVGVISLEASRGKAVWDVILRAGVGAVGAGGAALPSRDSGRVVAASSASVRLTRFAVGLPIRAYVVSQVFFLKEEGQLIAVFYGHL
jgi:hypothetical protein